MSPSDRGWTTYTSNGNTIEIRSNSQIMSFVFNGLSAKGTIQLGEHSDANVQKCAQILACRHCCRPCGCCCCCCCCCCNLIQEAPVWDVPQKKRDIFSQKTWAATKFPCNSFDRPWQGAKIWQDIGQVILSAAPGRCDTRHHEMTLGICRYHDVLRRLDSGIPINCYWQGHHPHDILDKKW